jgi:hypothetical protein
MANNSGSPKRSCPCKFGQECCLNRVYHRGQYPCTYRPGHLQDYRSVEATPTLYLPRLRPGVPGRAITLDGRPQMASSLVWRSRLRPSGGRVKTDLPRDALLSVVAAAADSPCTRRPPAAGNRTTPRALRGPQRLPLGRHPLETDRPRPGFAQGNSPSPWPTRNSTAAGACTRPGAAIGLRTCPAAELPRPPHRASAARRPASISGRRSGFPRGGRPIPRRAPRGTAP